MKYLSICSGIEAASAAWHQFGWQPIAFAEIEPFPSAVLAHHYPNVPNLGDMTRLPEMILRGEVEAPDLLVGGTPCQAFSVAGLRNSLDDNRGRLTLTFIRIADAIDHVRRTRGESPCIIVWENVPGVLSTSDNAFGCFLGALAGEDGQLEPSGKRWTNAGAVFGPERTIAWRILDAQYFGVAQRRRRVFVVASARDGFDSVEVLFEFDGVRRDSAPSREARQSVATLTKECTGVSRPGHNEDGWYVPDRQWPADVACTAEEVSHTLDQAQGQAVVQPIPYSIMPMNSGKDYKAREVEVAQPLMAGGPVGGNQGGDFIVQPVTYDLFNVTAPVNRQNRQPGDPCHPLARANAEHAVVVGVDIDNTNITVASSPDQWLFQNGKWPAEVAPTLNAAFGSKQGLEDQHALGGAGLFVPATIYATDGQSNAAFSTEVALSLISTNEAPYVAQPIGGGFDDATDLVAQTYSTPGIGHIVQDDVASTIRKNTGAGGETQNPAYVAQPIGFNTRQDPDAWQDRTGPVDTHYGTQGVAQPVAIHENQRAEVTLNDTAGTVKCAGGKPGQGYPAVMVAPSLTASNDPSRSPQSSEVTQQVGAVYQAAMQVRRLTPTECERLQGFPDGWTDIPWRGKLESPDGPRYKALGNSMAVPCMAWIGNRINQHDVLH